MSSCPLTNPLVTLPKAPITIGKTVTLMFTSFLNFLARSQYLSFFSLSLNFTLISTGTTKFTILQVFFFFQGLVDWPRLDDPFVSQNPRGVCVSHSRGQMLCYACTICSYGLISISCPIPCGSPCPPSRVQSYTFSVLICCICLLCDYTFLLYHHVIYIISIIITIWHALTIAPKILAIRIKTFWPSTKTLL